jgi:transcriptional regulator with XRE-family HTH domain
MCQTVAQTGSRERRMGSGNKELSNFCKNIRFLANLHRLKQEGLAKELGWNRTVLTKLLTGKREANVTQKSKLALYFRIEPAELELDHVTFCEQLNGNRVSSGLPLLTFRTLRENTKRWRASFEKYRGQYLVYYQQKEKDTVVGSLLAIDRLTGDGLHATMVNPHRDSSGIISVYEYEGYAYPVREYLYFLLEQKNADFEILSLILHEARTPSVHLLKGLISGIGVAEEVSYIAARPLVAIKRQRLIDDWRSAVGNELGYRPQTSIPEAAQRQLSSEKVTVLT